jgi:O-antigen ligase
MSGLTIHAAADASGARRAIVLRGLSALPALVAGLTVGGLAAGRGGYFPTAWGWAAVPLCWLAAITLCLRALPRLAPLEVALVSGLAVFACWIAVSTAWSQEPSRAVLEVERALVYPAGILAVLLLARRADVRQVLGGVLAGIVPVCAYALATRLLPERLGTFDSIAGYRLSHPVTYWNALGVLAAIGSLLALDFALRGGLVSRALAAASLPVLLPTLYFTYSRGAWLALTLGFVAAVALDPRRLQLASGLVLVAPAAVATWLGSRSAALTHLGSTLGRAEHDGHRLALIVVVLALVSAGLAFAFARAESRLSLRRAQQRVYAAAVLLAVAAGIVATLVRFGGPAELARKGYDSFTSPPVQVGAGGSLNKRLFSLSSNGRIDLWRIAAHDFERHPLLGSGAGSYESVYLLRRTTSGKVRDAHSLYVETLGELGVIGLLLLVAALLVPVVGAVRARRHPLVPAAFGAYVAYLFHAGVDWDWEMTGITLAALLCGAALLLAAREERERAPLPATARAAMLAGTLAVCAFSFVGLLGNTAIASSQHAIVDGRWANAASQARRALRWASWSPQAREYLGEAQFALGQRQAGLANVRRAIRAEPRDWDLWWTLALLTHGSTRRAATLEALRLNPRSPELADWIAGVGLRLPERPSR